MNRNFCSAVALVAAALIFLTSAACNATKQNAGGAAQNGSPTPAPATASAPTIEVSPTDQGGGQWRIAKSDTINVSVTAPGAQVVKIFYQPVEVTNSYKELTTLNSPNDAASGRFSTQVKIGEDFTGNLWAEADYPDGSNKQTPPVSVTTEATAANAPSNQNGQNPNAQNQRADVQNASGQSLSDNSDESAREDKFTGGHIEKTALQPNQKEIKITVNVPAFQLTLWQNGKEVKTYQIAVGRKKFPLPVGERKATQIIFNPDWIPPDSSWVADMKNVEAGEHIEADDPRNPLGKIKIPLGNGILIHQIEHPSDIGRAVSHGCIRMSEDDLFDLASKIIAACGLPVTKDQIAHARESKDRFAVKLDSPLEVDINYDTQVIEAGVLHLYPDLYDRNANTIEKLRDELQSSGVDASNIDDQTLKQMYDRVTLKEQFVVSVADLKSGRALEAGRTEPLTNQSATTTKGKRPANEKRRSETQQTK